MDTFMLFSEALRHHVAIAYAPPHVVKLNEREEKSRAGSVDKEA